MMNIEDEVDNNSIQNFQIIPIMPEAMGVFHIAKEKHLEFKIKIEQILNTADDKYRGHHQSKRESIGNDRFQNVLLDFPELTELHSILKNTALNFIKESGYLCDEVIITDAWINKYPFESTLPNHRHANSYISGNYFIDYDNSINSPLVFVNDRHITSHAPSIKLEADPSKPTPYNKQVYTIVCDESMVLLWKSHLLHGVKTPEKGEGRITLSFNVMPKVVGTGKQFSFAVSENNRV